MLISSIRFSRHKIIYLSKWIKLSLLFEYWSWLFHYFVLSHSWGHSKWNTQAYKTLDFDAHGYSILLFTTSHLWNILYHTVVVSFHFLHYFLDDIWTIHSHVRIFKASPRPCLLPFVLSTLFYLSLNSNHPRWLSSSFSLLRLSW